MPMSIFELYLKECEWHFNHSEIKVQISILKQLIRFNLIWLFRAFPYLSISFDVSESKVSGL
jgi:transposase